MSRSLSIDDPRGELDSLCTPCFIVPTEYGLVPHIPPDVSGNYPLFFSSADLIDNALPAGKTPLESLGLGKRWVFLGPSAPYFNFDEGPKKEGIPISQLSGATSIISIEKYDRLVEAVKPNGVVCLFSQIPPNATSRQKKLRIEVAKELTKSYPNTITFSHGLSQSKENCLFAQFSTFGKSEADVISRALSVFGPGPRMIHLDGHPLDVVRAFRLGFDLFVSPLPVRYARQGHALAFSYDAFEGDGGEDAGGIPLSIDLRSRAFERDHSPVVEGCRCLCCRKHVRSYVHHLLNVHEMLAYELLVMHNISYYSEFIKSLGKNSK